MSGAEKVGGGIRACSQLLVINLLNKCGSMPVTAATTKRG